VCSHPPSPLAPAAANFFAGHLNTLPTQTHRGIAAFFSSLRILPELPEELRGDDFMGLLGRFYRLTRSAPAVNVLRRVLLKTAPVPRPAMLVLLDACYALFRRIVPAPSAATAVPATSVRVGW
jgi:hypothetical protein